MPVARELQPQPRAPGSRDCQMRSLARGHASEERDVIVLAGTKRVLAERQAVMDDPHTRHRLPPRLVRADRHVLSIRISRVLFAELRLVRMMERLHDGLVDEARERNAHAVVEVNDVGAS